MAAKKPVSTKEEKLLRMVECPICLNELHDPRLLSCLHSLCYKCLKDYVEKGDYGDQLPCPVCRKHTPLYTGGVDDLPPNFFMNTLKDVVKEEDINNLDISQPEKGPSCSVEDCGQSAVYYCTHGCDFLCQGCHDDHKTSKFFRRHTSVIPASDAKTLPAEPPSVFPPCSRHKHQVLDLYCRTCLLPICNTCSNSSHRDHDCIELEEQAEVCKKKMKRISKHTEMLLDQVKRAMVLSESEKLQAEKDIDSFCEEVKSAFQIIRDKLNKEEETILTDLRQAYKQLDKTASVTTDSQNILLASLESQMFCQKKLTSSGSLYDYVTSTDCMERDMEKCVQNQQLPSLLWKTDLVKTDKGVSINQPGRVEITQSECKQEHDSVLRLGQFKLQEQEHPVFGMVYYKDHIYLVHVERCDVYCYTCDGSFKSKYTFSTSTDMTLPGMCMVMTDEVTMLIISDCNNNLLHHVMVQVTEEGQCTIERGTEQHLDYNPGCPHSYRGEVLVPDPENHKIHRYTHDGKQLSVITLPDNIMPYCMTCYSDSSQYVITDWQNHQVVITDTDGQVIKHYKDKIKDIKLDSPWDIITDLHDRLLFTDHTEHQVLLLSREGEEVKQLLQQQHVKHPTSLVLDDDNQRLFVAGRDQDDIHHIFIYDYPVLTGDMTRLTEKVITFELTVEL